MSDEPLQLDNHVVIPVMEPLRQVSARLLELLDDLRGDDWSRPTVHPDRDVKDLAAHLLHGSLRRVTALRDNYHRPGPTIRSTGDLIEFIQADNRDFMIGMRRISPAIIRESLTHYDSELLDLFAILGPHDRGLAVTWAGQQVSPNWFDIAREYTEKWHHQQQIRDATGRPPLYEPELLEPVLETLARGLPFALRAVKCPIDSRIFIATHGAARCAWTLRGEPDGWTLWRDDPSPGTPRDGDLALSIAADAAWRMWTKGLKPDDARAAIQISRGGSELSDPSSDDVARQVLDAIVSFVAIMA